jgi:integrase/recombinase XerD
LEQLLPLNESTFIHAGDDHMTSPELIVRGASTSLPSVFTVRPEARTRMRDFFSSHIRNKNTRRAYLEAVRQFSAFCAVHGIEDLSQVEPVHVAAFVEDQLRMHSKPTVKQRLAALRMLFDWMVVGQVLAVNPAHAVRGPKHTQRKGKTPVLNVDEARVLIDAIDTTSLPGLRDRALIALMVYTFARVGAAVAMKVEDFFVQGRRGWVRLHEKGGKEHEMPTHHNLDRYLEEYIRAAGIAEDRKSPLFRTTRGRSGELTANSLLQPDVWRMIRRRALAAGIETEIGCHTFRATGITAYLKNGGKLEIAQRMAAHESSRTTGLYDRRDDEVSLDEVERIGI